MNAHTAVVVGVGAQRGLGAGLCRCARVTREAGFIAAPASHPQARR
jgi:hypothetical protein